MTNLKTKQVLLKKLKIDLMKIDHEISQCSNQCNALQQQFDSTELMKVEYDNKLKLPAPEVTGLNVITDTHLYYQFLNTASVQYSNHLIELNTSLRQLVQDKYLLEKKIETLIEQIDKANQSEQSKREKDAIENLLISQSVSKG